MNKIKLSADEQLCREMKTIFEKYYSQTISENVKRALTRKKLSAQKIITKK